MHNFRHGVSAQAWQTKGDKRTDGWVVSVHRVNGVEDVKIINQFPLRFPPQCYFKTSDLPGDDLPYFLKITGPISKWTSYEITIAGAEFINQFAPNDMKTWSVTIAGILFTAGTTVGVSDISKPLLHQLLVRFCGVAFHNFD